MPATYKLIESKTITSNTTTVDFTNIPQTYTHLVFLSEFVGTANINFGLRFNSDSSSTSYQTQMMVAQAGVPRAGVETRDTTAMNWASASYESPNRGQATTYIFDYSSTSLYKRAVTRSGSPLESNLAISSWLSTSAVTSLQFVVLSNQITNPSYFSLYGIKEA